MRLRPTLDRGQGPMTAFRLAGRRLLRERSFSAVVIFMLALGIGASTVIFTVIDGVLLRPLPYHEPERIVRVFQVDDAGRRYSSMSDPNFFDLKERSRAFAAFAQYGTAIESVAGGMEPARVTVAYVSNELFEVLGVQPLLGRGFTPEEQRPGGRPAALIGYAYWQRYLAGAPDFAERTLRNGQRVYSIVGVMPPGFDYPEGAEMWVPTEIWPPSGSRTAHNYRAVGRLADGVALPQAEAELGTIAGGLLALHGDDTRMADVALSPLHDELVAGVRPALRVLAIAALLLLAAACANTLSMLLARIVRREEELAVRRALGAERRHLARDLFAEAMLLACSGAALGLLLAGLALQLLVSLGGSTLPRAALLELDWPAAAFAFAVALAVAGGLSALAAWRAPVREAALRADARVVGPGPHGAFRDVLASGQVAIAVVLMVGVLLLGRSFIALTSVDPGFRPEDTVLIDLATTWSSEQFGERADLRRFYDDVLEQIRTLPSVTAAGGVSIPPAADGRLNGTYLELASADEVRDLAGLIAALGEPARGGQAQYRVASEGYFAAMGVQLIRGRLFERGDDEDAEVDAAVVSRALADARWPGQNPIGKLIQFGGMDGDFTPFRVVGVVADVRDRLDRAVEPTFYASFRQRSRQIASFWVAVRARDAEHLIPALRAIVQRANRDVAPVFTTGEVLFESTVAQRRLDLSVLAWLGGAAFAVALAGIYAAIAFNVARRTHEIGVRIALGALGRSVTAMVVRRAMVVAGAGIAAGLAAALAASRLFAALLYGVPAYDPLSYGSAGAALFAACAAAAWLPAARAARVDPLMALRSE